MVLLPAMMHALPARCCPRGPRPGRIASVRWSAAQNRALAPGCRLLRMTSALPVLCFDPLPLRAHRCPLAPHHPALSTADAARPGVPDAARPDHRAPADRSAPAHAAMRATG